MNYAIVNSGMVENIIVAEPEVAAELGGLPVYEGCVIGEAYAPPHEYTTLERTQQEITDKELSIIELGQAVTDLELAAIEQGQAHTDLELMILGGKSNV